MTEVCKLLFDFCFYYALSGFYLYLFFGDYPFILGIPVLILSAVAHIALKTRTSADKRPEKNGLKAVTPIAVICCALPGVLFAFGPTLWQILQYIPAWAFLGYSILTDRIHMDRGEFQQHFSFTGKLFGLAAFGVIAVNQIGYGLIGAIPYLILYLLTGVCLMRILRDDGAIGAGRNIAVLLILLSGSGILALLRTPQLFLDAVKFIYQNIIAYILIGIVMVFGTIGYGIFKFFAWIASLFGDGASQRQSDVMGSAKDIYDELGGAPLNGTPAWLRITSMILLVFLVAFVIFLIMRKLLGRGPGNRKPAYLTEQQEKLIAREKNRKYGMFRPREPREAVRWYYRKYLKEGAAKGPPQEPADTSLHILRKYSPFFPADDAVRLRDLYIKSRYRYNGGIPKEDADAVSDIWQRLR